MTARDALSPAARGRALGIDKLAHANNSLHMPGGASEVAGPTGDQLVVILATLANPHRMRVIAALVAGRTYVSQLARDLDISRPLLQIHLRKLEAAGLVRAQLELSTEGKAMKYYEVAPFALTLTPEVIVTAAQTLTDTARDGGEQQ